jgi:hypothetical protein
MANVITTYTRDRGAAKANIRYITRRPGKDNEKITRTLFGLDGVMSKEEAFRMIEDAKEGSYFYRIVLSPDPEGEDTKRDLRMRELTLQTMQALDKRLNHALVWAGALHADHAPHRHVHILAISPRRLNRKDFKELRLTATNESLAQRRELDKDREQKPHIRLTHSRSIRPDYTNRKTSRQARGGSQASMHICTCPRCGATHVAYGRNRAHPCTCGLLLHRKKEPALQRKGGGRER